MNTALYEHAEAAVTSANARITDGNFRQVQRLLAHIERIVAINNLPIVATVVTLSPRETGRRADLVCLHVSTIVQEHQ